jgi:hypothetical protein
MSTVLPVVPWPLTFCRARIRFSATPAHAPAAGPRCARAFGAQAYRIDGLDSLSCLELRGDGVSGAGLAAGRAGGRCSRPGAAAARLGADHPAMTGGLHARHHALCCARFAARAARTCATRSARTMSEAGPARADAMARGLGETWQ